jgi:two-component system chemotaxis sensor kinase CheA
MFVDESMLDVYIYESQQLLEKMEQALFEGEKDKKLNSDQVNEIFRAMHTIKGSSSIMEFDGMTKLAHTLEDMFALIRDKGVASCEWPLIFDLAFSAVGFFNAELSKLLDKKEMDGNPSELIEQIKDELKQLQHAKTEAVNGETAQPGVAGAEDKAHKPDEENSGPVVMNLEKDPDIREKCDKNPCYKLKVIFEEEAQMENIRAFGIVQSLKAIASSIITEPEDLNLDGVTEKIKAGGFCAYVRTAENPDNLKKILQETLFVKSFSVIHMDPDAEYEAYDTHITDNNNDSAYMHDRQDNKLPVQAADTAAVETIAKQNFISVNVNKLDNLLNIVGEIVTAQSMVTNNADFENGSRDSFDASAQQLRSLINELQDVVMSIRMIPVSTLFQKMRRLVRDMSKKVGKEVELELIGEETEVDKNVIDYLSDPLLHIVRNSIDHGIEETAVRLQKGKPARGKITLEARTTGNDVIVTVSDDGQWLQKDAILKKAYDKGLISRLDEEMADKDIYNLVFLPGFSTNDNVTEYSGRGVGMDVVHKNISQIGGNVTLSSEPGKGLTTLIRIPLTLTIVNGMKFNIGDVNFIVPTVSVLSIAKPDSKNVFSDPDGHEMIMIQKTCYPLIRLNNFFGLNNGVTEINDGMIMRITSDDKTFCIFFDRLDGEYQVVVKALPPYLSNCTTRLEGIGGCAILGDGSINLILDVNGLQLP